MILNQRERFIGIATVAVVLLAIVYQYALTPVLNRRNELDAEAEAARLDLDRATRLLDNSRRMKQRWSEVVTAGLQPDAQQAESQLLQSLHDWAAASGLNPPSLKPVRTERQKHFDQVTLRATATGGMRHISEFLWRLQTAEQPIRVLELQISSRKEGTDDLSMQLTVSTIALAPEPTNPDGAKPEAERPLAMSFSREVSR